MEICHLYFFTEKQILWPVKQLPYMYYMSVFNHLPGSSMLKLPVRTAPRATHIQAPWRPGKPPTILIAENQKWGARSVPSAIPSGWNFHNLEHFQCQLPLKIGIVLNHYWALRFARVFPVMSMLDCQLHLATRDSCIGVQCFSQAPNDIVELLAHHARFLLLKSPLTSPALITSCWGYLPIDSLQTLKKGPIVTQQN